MFLSATNLFHAHALTRSLSNSPETMLTTLALVYFPLPPPTPTSDPLLGGRRSDESIALASDRSSQYSPQSSTLGRKEDEPKPVTSVEDLDYVAMDRGGPAFDDETYVHVHGINVVTNQVVFTRASLWRSSSLV
jgi:phosphatidylinositol glycan class B